ncbi:hypothetical protein [Planococcus salinarum]|uniref:hypothetical protein n=1 Tax=Planococcus salinarum TaxID=622695 RepID=UPI000E3D1E83|nr:hypothetical protein [Planococcus salinarum]TAA71717.1 hypothetical protein D2909_10350 [Planococcus salinarum]
MENFVGYIFVALTIAGFGYALVWQIRDTLEIKSATKPKSAVGKRKLVGYYLMSVSLAGFFVSYLLNVAIGLLIFVRPETVQHALVNSNTTAAACFIFLVVYFVSRFWIVPKEETGQRLLKVKI